MGFAVAQSSYSGPLELLLELIEGQKLPITSVSLASVADAYVTYVKEASVQGDELADFLLIAARLIYLKSRELIPYLYIEEEENAVADLEERLRLYKEFLEVAELLNERFGAATMYARQRAERKKIAQNAMPANVHAQALADSFQGVIKRLEPFFALREAKMDKTISVEEKIEKLHEALRSRAKMTFRETVGGDSKESDVVVSFLALLELLRRKAVKAEQSGAFQDIHLTRSE